MRLLTSLFLLALALPAQLAAQSCPTSADLGKGIKFSVNDTDSEVFTRTSNGMIQSIYSGPDFASRVLLVKGLYLVEVVDLENGQPLPDSRTTYTFPQNNTAAPVPQPRLVWNADIVVNDVGDIRNETQSYTFGEMWTLSIGNCSYDMIPVRIVYNGDDNAADELHYLPQLGISYLSKFIDGETVDAYNYHSIEVVQ